MSEEKKDEKISTEELQKLRDAAAEAAELKAEQQRQKFVAQEAAKIVHERDEIARRERERLQADIAAMVRQMMPEQVEETIVPGIRLSTRLEFPLGSREGNLSRADKQFLAALLGRKAMTSTGAGSGDEWVPTELANELVDLVRADAKVIASCQNVDMPTNPYRIPKVSADPTVYGVPDELSQATVSNPTTGYIELNAKKVMGTIEWSGELDEDSVLPMVATLKKNLATALAEAAENLVINGDTESTQANNINYSASYYDVHRLLDGMRKHAKTDDATYTSLCADVSADQQAGLRAIRAAMGRCGADPSKLMWVPSIGAYLDMLSFTTVQTLEKYGPSATVLTGELAKWDGIPIVASGQIPKTNANGVVGSANNDYDLCLLVYRPYMYVGWRRQIKLETDRNIQLDKNILVASLRLAFDVAINATANFAPLGCGYKM